MNFRSLQDLTRCLERNAAQLREADVIVGIPRSGLLVANLLALQLHKPIAELGGFLRGERIGAGWRLQEIPMRLQHAVVIDDSALTGREMRIARRKVAQAGVIPKVKFGCVYATAAALPYLDFWFEVLPHPRLFEWNLLHHPILAEAGMDMDGFLCRNPTEQENDDGSQYETFLEAAEPYLLPQVPIGAIVTCRLEKYRRQTECWLNRNGIAYGRLVMMNCGSKAERLARGHAAFKADAYRAGRYRLFLESSAEQAREIFGRTRRPVFCVEKRCLFK